MQWKLAGGKDDYTNRQSKSFGRHRMWQAVAVIIVSVLAFATIVGCCAFSAPGYFGPKSEHFDGRRFFNQDRRADRGPLDHLKWIINRERGKWQKWTNAEPGPKPLKRVGNGELRVTFINHSTLLIQMDSMNILTDPAWSERSSPVWFAGPRRVRSPGIRFEDLPPIDVVVVSHNHYDHLDLPTLKRLYLQHKPKIYVGLGNKLLLDRSGIEQVCELDWWQQVELSNSIRLACVPAQHFSGRGLCDRNKTLWAGFVFESQAGTVYFAGDTGFSSHFEQISDRFGPIRLALLPIGAFLPKWFMSAGHLSPDDALKAHFILGAKASVAMHFGTFPMADDGQSEPADRLSAAIAETGMRQTRFWILGFGEGRAVPPMSRSPDDEM